MFGDGSNLIPRAELRYIGGYYLGQATTEEAEKTDEEGNSLHYLDYLYQGSVLLGNITATWNSADGKYGVTAYVRNVTDKRYKIGASLPAGTPLVNVTVGEPRTWGVMLSGKF